jgi:hypothetical protein
MPGSATRRTKEGAVASAKAKYICWITAHTRRAWPWVTASQRPPHRPTRGLDRREQLLQQNFRYALTWPVRWARPIAV